MKRDAILNEIKDLMSKINLQRVCPLCQTATCPILKITITDTSLTLTVNEA